MSFSASTQTRQIFFLSTTLLCSKFGVLLLGVVYEIHWLFILQVEIYCLSQNEYSVTLVEIIRIIRIGH